MLPPHANGITCVKRVKGRTRVRREDDLVITTEILDASIHYGVSIEEAGTLRMLRERETITLKIQLEEYLTTLDSVQANEANVEDLLEPDTLEEEKAFTLQSGGLTLTILKGIRDPNETPKLCSALNLKMFILSDILQMDWNPRINHLVTDFIDPHG